jgi:hypothetical protein
MNDREFLQAFEALTFPADSFHHRDHVRLAWIYLREDSLLGALARFRTSLRRFAQNAGAAGVYHETITLAFLLVIHERMAAGQTFDQFAAANPDLFTWKPSVLDRYYRGETLQSDLARATFVLPDAV